MCCITYFKCVKYIFSLYCLFYNESDKNIENVKKNAEECGPIGQKLLQFLIMHNGFLTNSCKAKFSYIFEDCYKHSWESTRTIYRQDFGHEIENDFEISPIEQPIPVGSGTIGQVYKLYNKTLKQHLAVKVRHINIELQAADFIQNICSILDVAKNFIMLPFAILVKEFLRNINMQLDYNLETQNTNIMQENCKNDKHIIIPTIYYNSERVIVMSYHDGVSFINIKDEKLKSRIAADMFMFNLSCLLVHDLLHCDLHYGNWKIILSTEEPDNYKLLIYDCGITGSTKNNLINRQICIACMDGDYNKVLSILTPEIDNHKNGELMKEYTDTIMDTYYSSRLDKMTDFLKHLFIYKININTEYLRCIQGLLTCISVLLVTSEKLLKVLGKEGARLEIFISYYSGVLRRIDKYPSLLKYFEDWIAADPNIDIVFYDWLDDVFGHRDKGVFIDAMLLKLMY